jgi:hypothetical protein
MWLAEKLDWKGLMFCKKSNKRHSSDGTVVSIRKVTFHVDVTNDAYLGERLVDVLQISSLHCSDIHIFSFYSLFECLSGIQN